ncbi:MAG: molybdopterin-dependent oxidoreductase, partial [Pseudomonadota bacterium]
MTADGTHLTSNHWGMGLVQIRDGRVIGVDPHPRDLEPSAINDNIAGSLAGRARVLRPAVRQGWLEGRRGVRGREPFVEVSWEEALGLVAQEVARLPGEAVYAGSYGWASAGRFHHAQSQLKRFLNTQKGFV